MNLYPPAYYAAAKAAHETNRAYCESLGDYSQVPWVEAPENIKESALNGVNFVANNPGAEPSASHDNWYKFKLEDGWSYGPDKDPVNKRHPCMVPFKELPIEQQMKDVIFRCVVTAALRLNGAL